MITLALLLAVQSPAQVEAALREHAADVHGCYARALAPDMTAHGKVTARLVLGDGGHVTKAEIVDDDLNSPAATSCLKERLLAWNLPGLGPSGTELVLPFLFEPGGAQHAVKLADVEPVPKAQPKATPPLQTWLLIDEKSAGAKKATLAIVQVGAKAKIAMHKHPSSAEILYVLDGHGRLLIPGAAEPEKLEPGTAVFIKAGTAHSIDNQSGSKNLRLLQSFVPPGPEVVLRDRSKAGGTEVIKGTAPNAPAGAYKVVREDDVKPLTIAGGKAKVRILLDKESTGEEAAYLGVLEADAGAKVPEHKHDKSDEILFVVKGDAKTVIGGAATPGEDETAVHIPENTLHTATFAAPTRAIQIYAPAGPEQRFKQPPTAPKK